MQNVELAPARGSSAPIGEIDDLTVCHSINGGVWLVDKAFQTLRKPVITASLHAIAIHSLLDDDPLAIIGHDESVQIKIKSVLHGGAIDLGDEPTRVRER